MTLFNIFYIILVPIDICFEDNQNGEVLDVLAHLF